MIELTPHQINVVREAAELGERINSLIAFRETPEGKALPLPYRSLLSDQLFYMREYHRVLKLRLQRWGA